MHKYRITYQLYDGIQREEIIDAVNRIAAWEVFEDMHPFGVKSAECYRIPVKEDEEQTKGLMKNLKK